MLCDTCKNIFAKIRPRGDYKGFDYEQFKGHHRTIEDLHEAAVGHCQICAQLFRYWEQQYWDTFGADSTLSSHEKERTMISEVMECQRKYMENLETESDHPSDQFLSTYSIGAENPDSEETPDKSKLELAFKTNGKCFNTSRNSTGRAPDSWYDFFVMLPPERMRLSFIIRLTS